MSKRNDKQFERAVAAAFQADGQYVERNRRDPEEHIIETDVVALDFRPTGVRTAVCECKNTDSGASDLFKLAGRCRPLAPSALVPTGEEGESSLWAPRSCRYSDRSLSVGGATEAVRGG